eukprot:1194804-Prorocentrum_minimum.AAC.3
MGALFLAGSVAVGVVNKIPEEDLTNQLLDGAVRAVLSPLHNTTYTTEIYILFARALQFEAGLLQFTVIVMSSTWKSQNWNQLPPCQSGPCILPSSLPL